MDKSAAAADKAAGDPARAAAAEKAFKAAKDAAAALYRSRRYNDAADAFSTLIAATRVDSAAAGAADKHGALAHLPRAFKRQALPGLLSNRAACSFELGEMEAVESDCTDALTALKALGVATPATPSAFKVTLRRAEARRQQGRMAQVRRDSEALSAMAASEEEKAAAGFLALQVAVIAVE